MSRYDGLIIPRSYSEYINKTDAATLQQALQLSGVLSGAVAAGDNKAVTSDAVNVALANISEIKQLYDVSHRPSSANIIPKNDKMSYMLATAEMTENKPISDGYILNLNWDNGGILTQLYLPDYSDNGRIGTRVRNPNGEWSNWGYYTKESDIFTNYKDFILIKQNENFNSTERGVFTATKNVVINMSNNGSASSTSEIAWGRVLIENKVIGSYRTTSEGMGTTLFIKAGTTIYYDLHNNDVVQLSISYKYFE